MARSGTNHRGGRPIGAATKLSRKRANELAEQSRTPLDIVLENMFFWHDATKDLAKRIEAMVVNVEDADERREAYGLLRSYLAAREHSQSCAVDALPYCHPRLQAITFKQDVKQSIDISMNLPKLEGNTSDRDYRDPALDPPNVVPIKRAV